MITYTIEHLMPEIVAINVKINKLNLQKQRLEQQRTKLQEFCSHDDVEKEYDGDSGWDYQWSSEKTYCKQCGLITNKVDHEPYP